MNVYLLVIALACRADAPKAGFPEAAVAPAAVASAAAFPAARAVTDSSVAGLYRGRFLSGPWSVSRRLEAARMRGDAEEAERLTAKLAEVVGEALEVEGTGP